VSAFDQDAVRQGLETACRRLCFENVKVDQLQRLTAGASAATWKFNLTRGVESSPRIAQLFAGGTQFSAALDKRTQGMVQQAAFNAGVRTPRIDGIIEPGDGIGEGFISEFVAGETLGQRIVREPALAKAREHMVQQCAELLAGIHGIDSDTLPELPARSPAALVDDLAATHATYGQNLPVFELGFQWLRQHASSKPSAKLVHGDFRNGNFIVDQNGIAAVLDWEQAHLGDPHEDLGWLCMNAWRFGVIDKAVGGFGERAKLYAAYQLASGTTVDPQRVRFWELFGTLKWGVICQWFAHQFLSGEVQSLERAAIGRRVAETELDALDLIEGIE